MQVAILEAGSGAGVFLYWFLGGRRWLWVAFWVLVSGSQAKAKPPVLVCSPRQLAVTFALRETL